MNFIRSSMSGNAHFLNYVLILSATVVPVMIYSNMRSPSQEQVETVLLEKYGDKMDRVRHNTEKINQFWKVKRNSQEMDSVYSDLLRSGSGSMKRHYELTGSLGQDAAHQDPEYARMQRLLSLPETTSVAKPAAEPAAAAAAVTTTTTTSTPTTPAVVPSKP